MSIEVKQTLQGSFLGIIMFGAILMMIAYFGHGHDMGIPSPESRASAMRPNAPIARIYHFMCVPRFTTNVTAHSGCWTMLSRSGEELVVPIVRIKRLPGVTVNTNSVFFRTETDYFIQQPYFYGETEVAPYATAESNGDLSRPHQTIIP